jgi:FG-GAP-like repeat
VSAARWAALGAVGGIVATFVSGAAGAQAGDPSFVASALVPGPRTPCAAAPADLNGDGHADLAVVDCRSKNLTALLGDGAGGFIPAAGSPVPVGVEVASVVAADVNRDAKPDLALLSGSEVRLLLGDGSGRFSVAPGSPVKIAVPAFVMTAADLNRDGSIDLVVVGRQSQRARIVSLLGDGSGRFTPRTPVSIGDIYSSSLAAADFNGDAKADLAVGQGEESRLSIVLGDGAGGFRAGTTVRARLLAVADFNGDGKPDLAVAADDPDGVNLRARALLGTGAGRFRPAGGSAIAVGSSVVGAAADLNGDGRLDLAVAGAGLGVSALLGNGAGRFRLAVGSPFPLSAPTFFPQSWPDAIFAADLNGDDKPDLAVPGASRRGEGLTTLWQTPSTPEARAGGALPGRRDTVFSTRGGISRLAVDGNRVAVMTGPGKGTCGRVVVWTAPGRQVKTFRTDEGCVERSTIPYHVVEVSLGAGQVAWLGEGGGNTLELLIHVAKLSGGRARQIEYANNGNGAGGSPEGNWVGQLLGGGPLLVYNRWKAVCSAGSDSGCSWSEPTLRLVQHRLVRIVAGHRVVMKRGPDSYPVSAVGGGRMAVKVAGVVTVLGSRGGRVAAVPEVQGNPPRAIALSRTRLAVERTSDLDVHDPATGAKSKSIPLGPAAGLELVGVNSKVALLRGPRRLVLVRLTDGKLVSPSYRKGTAATVVAVRLTEVGLFYAYNVRSGTAKGRIVFEPTVGLLERFAS